jgi:hypothetical protein
MEKEVAAAPVVAAADTEKPEAARMQALCPWNESPR